jgi:hypothetical protein
MKMRVKIAIVIGFMTWLLAACGFPQPAPVAASFAIENPRMTRGDLSSSACNMQAADVFSADETVWIAWTEIGRQSDQSIAIHVYDDRDREVFGFYEPKVEAASTSRNCRSLQVKRLQPGQYSTAFVIEGRPSAYQALWFKVTQIPTPTPTPTLTPAPTLLATAMPPSYFIEDPRMVHYESNLSSCTL